MRTPGAQAQSPAGAQSLPDAHLDSAKLRPIAFFDGPSTKPSSSQPADQPEAPESNRAGDSAPVADPCKQNVQIAASKGLTPPEGWEFHCVGPGLDWDGNSHWGVTCPYSQCPEGDGPYVSVSNPTYYVIAHELCHANYGNSELMADRCAAEHGASLATSPYQG